VGFFTGIHKSVANSGKSGETRRNGVFLALGCMGEIEMNGVSLARNLLVRFKSLLPSDLRAYYQPFIYGLVGGLSAVAFQASAQALFQWLWIAPSKSLPFRVVVAKFFGGVITIGGGSSLGREGPTVHIAGTLASNVAGLLGAPKQERRPALLAGAAAGLAAAFNTPLSAITSS
jgi:H+/Cl- antiporter ClcA